MGGEGQMVRAVQVTLWVLLSGERRATVAPRERAACDFACSLQGSRFPATITPKRDDRDE